ncbi:vacuolar import and degradation protein-domain-containing protein [Kockiozyma suomiensis]|uniref:vacuolar import and degradation protein-domain-containing protein n=1 Tax=Kockiozyma suomiensis TaxID=1337062 RepID=UPI0033436425
MRTVHTQLNLVPPSSFSSRSSLDIPRSHPTTSLAPAPAVVHRPILQRASSLSSTSTSVPQLAAGLPFWTRADLYLHNSLSQHLVFDSSVSESASSSEQDFSTLSFTPTAASSALITEASSRTMSPVPYTEVSDFSSTPQKKSIGSLWAEEIVNVEQAPPSVISPPLPLPVEVPSDRIHSTRTMATSSSSFLRSGSKFMGTQMSGRQTYEVQVELKHVDMKESFVCGYLHINGLTEDNPLLTTYFEGEMIGPKHSFFTRRRDWGASEKTDIIHWARFPSWRPIAKMAKRPDYRHVNFEQRDHIFMRWKECFLVPDHRVRDINGASFAGFYYICFNQITGAISGLYFHKDSEKYQQLELSHVKDSGMFYSYEFR